MTAAALGRRGAAHAVALPDAMLSLVLQRKRLGKAAESQQRLEVVLRRGAAELAEGERAKPEMRVAIRERGTAFPIGVEPRGSHHDDATP